MLIIGAKGFAKEVLEIFHQLGKTENIAFYDDINTDIGDFLFDKFPILKNRKQAIEYFNKYGFEFTIGIGNPKLRYKLYKKFILLGGDYTSSISPLATIGNYGINISNGANILSNSTISNSVKIGKGCIVYYHSIITHDCQIGDFVEISPNVTILGKVKINSFVQIGAGTIILPDIKIGDNVIIGAGSVVTKDIPDNEIWFGSPAKFYKKNKPLKL